MGSSSRCWHFAVGGSGVARGRRNGLALTVSLLRHLPQSRDNARQVSFAIPVADADYRCEIVIDGKFKELKTFEIELVPT